MNMTPAQVVDLLARSNDNGLKVSLRDERLLLSFPKGKVVNEMILHELKENKNAIITHLKELLNSSPQKEKTKVQTAMPVIRNNEQYYQITPVQRYWVNEQKDKEFKEADGNHGSSLNTWCLHGDFDPNIFKAALQYLINRHESLRSTFHDIDGEYLMKIHALDLPQSHIQEFDYSVRPVLNDEIENIAAFSGHRFDFAKGPLFRVRIIKKDRDRFIVSLKTHHIITDLWSSDILLRDLLVAYRDLRVGKHPKLEPLRYQFKDYLATIIDDTTLNREKDELYWKSTLHKLPPELRIPGAVASSATVGNKVSKSESFDISKEVAGKIAWLSRSFSTSFFVVLQAVFKSFVLSKTGQTDLVIGTYIFGRQYPDAENQIGCYAKTVLIRTVLETTDPFGRIIKKVKSANADMQNFTGYTLMDACESMLGGKEDVCGSFWKVNLVYNDIGSSYTSQSNAGDELSQLLNVSVQAKDYKKNSHIPIDMHWDFLRNDERLTLVINYDSSTYSAEVIKDIGQAYCRHILETSV